MKIIVPEDRHENCPFIMDEFIICSLLPNEQRCDWNNWPKDCPLRKGPIIVEFEK
jgi:hypothetical protein